MEEVKLKILKEHLITLGYEDLEDLKFKRLHCSYFAVIHENERTASTFIYEVMKDNSVNLLHEIW